VVAIAARRFERHDAQRGIHRPAWPGRRLHRGADLGLVGAGSGKPAFRVVRAIRVHIEIDDFDATLRLSVTIARMPGPVAELNVVDFGKKQATPLPTGRQAFRAFAAELIGQRLLLALRVAEDDRAELARIAVIGAENLLSAGHRGGKKFVSLAWQGQTQRS
jgi:hypothetical protein